MERANATHEYHDEPRQKVEMFNAAYKAWMMSLQKQLPEMHQEFDDILDRLYVADAHDVGYPMNVFQWYTGPYVSLMQASDAAFFDHIGKDSAGKSMPVQFKDAFLSQLSELDRTRAWATLRYLMQLTAQVYPTYRLE